MNRTGGFSRLNGWAAHLGAFARRSTLGLTALWKEARYAKQASLRALNLYHVVRAERPDLAGRALYRQVVVRQYGIDAKAAEAFVQSAEQSFADWPHERDLAFRDVVHCMVFHGVLTASSTRPWTRVQIGRIVASVIPKDL